MPERTIQLKPSHYHLFWWYFLGILLLPLFGAGFVFLYLAYRKQSLLTYKIGNQTIIRTDNSYTETVDLINIQEIKVHQRWIDKKFSIGKLVLITETKSVEMIGIQNPKSLSDLILKAAETERLRNNTTEKIENTPKKTGPESLDRLDYLTGLWQQGLLSDEDFKKEKKHFEQ